MSQESSLKARAPISVLGEIMDFKITGAETGGSLCAVEITSFPKGGPPPHIHGREDEYFYILDGHFSFLLGDQIVEADPGSFQYVPKAILHTYQNIGTKPGKMLVIVRPVGFEGFWLEIGKRMELGTVPSPPDAETIGRALALAPKYGLEVKLP